MKKLYTLLLFACALNINAQVTNGDFETWTDATTAPGFTTYTTGLTQESTIIHGGLYSAKQTTLATSSVKIQSETTVIVPGTSYTISFWFLDNDPLAKSRPWIYWLDGANATIADNATEFRPSTYSEDNAQWIQYTVTVTAPATAAKLRFEMRTYSVGAGFGSIYYDDMSVQANLAVKQNSISGLNVYPNPVTNGVLFVTSDNNDTKSVAIFDVLGKQVVKTTVNNQGINVANLNAGVYIVKITENGKTATRKLVIR